jgi:hypothetical protein
MFSIVPILRFEDPFDFLRGRKTSIKKHHWHYKQGVLGRKDGERTDTVFSLFSTMDHDLLPIHFQL